METDNKTNVEATTTTTAATDAGAAAGATTGVVAPAAAAAVSVAGVPSDLAAAAPDPSVHMGLERILIPGSIRKRPNPAYVAGRGMQRKAVIVLHEWWGVTPALQRQAFEWFGEEFMVVVLDLYRGEVAKSVSEAGHLMHNLDFTQALRDIQAAAVFCKEKEGCAKVGVIGFSMSGALALAAAVHLKKNIDAVISLYGIPDPRFGSGASIGVPVQLHFGTGDTLPGFSDPSSQEQLETALNDANVPHEFYRYGDCGHNFCNPAHSDPVEKAAAAKVKERAQQFMTAKLN